MKNKLRKIRVAESDYVWSVTSLNANYVCIKIWKIETKSPAWVMVRYRFDDPWIHAKELAYVDKQERESRFQLQPVQPKHIAQIIEQVHTMTDTWTPLSGSTLNLEWLKDDKLIVVEKACE